MHRLIALSVAAVLGLALTVAVPASAAPVTVVNSGFEEPGSGVPSWNQLYGPAGAFNVVTGTASEGNASVRMVDPDRTVATGLASTRFPVTAGTPYHLSAAINRASGLPGLYLVYLDAAGAKVGQNEQFFSTPANQWSRATLASTAPAGATQAYALLYSSSYQITTAHFDDVRLEPAPYRERLVGTPITNIAVLGAGFGTTADGRQLAYLPLSGVPGTLAVVDAVTAEPVSTVEMPGSEGSWGVTTTADGAAYIASYPNGRLYRYRPETNQIEDLGKPIQSESFVWTLDSDDAGRIYGGTYPNGAVFQYDPATGAYRNYGPILPGSSYARDVSVHKGKIYVGLGTVGGHIVEIDAESGARREIPLPEKFRGESMVYDLDVRGDLIFARLADSSTLVVYDLRTNTWLNDLGPVKGLVTSEPGRAGEVFYLSSANHLMAFNLARRTVRDTGHTIGFGTRDFGWVELNQRNYPGQTLVMADFAGHLSYYNPITGANKRVSVVAEGVAVPLRSIGLGPDSKVYASGYQSGGLAAYDPATNALTRFPAGTVGQVEGFAATSDRLYLGSYPGSKLLSFDPTQPFSYGTNPAIFGDLQPIGQDRPVA